MVIINITLTLGKSNTMHLFHCLNRHQMNISMSAIEQTLHLLQKCYVYLQQGMP